MPITLDDDLADACLCAAAKADFPSTVRSLIDAGVNPDALFGAALTIAERYAGKETIELLRSETTDRTELFRRAALSVKLRGLEAHRPTTEQRNIWCPRPRP